MRENGPPEHLLTLVRTARRLAARLNTCASYEAFCAAQLARLPRSLRADAERAMQEPDGVWRTTYRHTQLVESMLLDSLDLLATGQLSTDAMRRFNAIQEAEHPLLPMLGQSGDLHGGVLALAVSARVLPEAPTVARLVGLDGAEPLAELWDVITAGTLNRVKRCPQCAQWFADASRNRNSTRCSTACTNRWWTRERRRNKKHAPAKKTTPRRARR